MRKLLLLTTTLCCASIIAAQSLGVDKITLGMAINIAQKSSPSAQVAQLSFMSKYWSFRSYKAELLPSINLNGTVGNYNRSISDVRDGQTGEVHYFTNNTLYNDLSLSIDQQIPFTGGTLSLNSSLSRLDQFSYDNFIYNTTPINISYNQPLFSFNELKWQKQSAPLEYESAKRTLLESMESITITTTSYFFAVLTAQTTLDNAIESHTEQSRMYEIARRRLELGTVTRSELLQLELALINSELAITESRTALDIAIFNFKYYLGLTESVVIELVPPSSIPDITLSYDFVLARALRNSTHEIDIELQELYADQGVAEAKANRGIQLELNANLGLSQSAYDFSGAYLNPLDKEIVGLTLSLPIFDWGLGRGRIRMAEAERKVTLTEIEQEEIKFRQDIFIKVVEFNNQIKQCNVARKAVDISRERYQILLERFATTGAVSVTDLNTAQGEMESANSKYISELSSYWSSYYEIQKLSLYNYIEDRDIDAEFDEIIDKQL